jgi:hypothetical protein
LKKQRQANHAVSRKTKTMKLQATIFTFLLLMFWVNANAQSNFNRNQSNIVLWGSAGYNNLPNNADGVNALGGVGASVGLGYEWHRNSFILQVGGEFYRHSSLLALDDFDRTFRLLDKEELLNGREEWYNETFYYSENRDKYTLSYVNIPLMLGFQKNRFYFLAGAKFGFSLQAQSQTTTTLRNTGKYDYSIDEIENIPGRFFSREETGRLHDLSFGFNTTASAEMGFYFGSRENNSRTKYRLALFADYGLLNINPHKSKEEILLYDPMNFQRPELNSFVKSSVFSDKTLNTFYTGLKLTVVFGLRQRAECRWLLCE